MLIFRHPISYFSVVVIKYYYQGNLEGKSLFCLTVPGGWESIIAGQTQQQEQEAERSHFQPQTQSRESKVEMEQGYESQILFQVTYFLEQGSNSPNSATWLYQGHFSFQKHHSHFMSFLPGQCGIHLKTLKYSPNNKPTKEIWSAAVHR